MEPFFESSLDLVLASAEIRVTHNGLCHSDVHVMREEWGPCKYPMVPGHEVYCPLEVLRVPLRTAQTMTSCSTLICSQLSLAPKLAVSARRDRKLLLQIVGVVEQLGSSVTHLKKGDTVGFGWFKDCCQHCDACITGNDVSALHQTPKCVAVLYMQALASAAAAISFGRLRQLLLMLGSHRCCEV